MSKALSCPNKALEVTVMFEPHRLQQTFLQAVYASLVPVSRKCLTLIQQSHPISWNGNRRLLAAEKGASHACITGALAHVTAQASENEETYALIALATHGRTGWGRLVVSSVIERVLAATRWPVLVVHPPRSGHKRSQHSRATESAPREARIGRPGD
ncbi:universal stress protein [Ktedonobacter sp. SOSP1-52]|uniref:universal stress protein n=1 Tax=Ktedonobacter sp. SOSP1-52 TaxID=2778366 RepID=UPI001915F2A4|nr:universal stress protein [Ktedonobacter sp. SOSP1-52]